MKNVSDIRKKEVLDKNLSDIRKKKVLDLGDQKTLPNMMHCIAHMGLF